VRPWVPSPALERGRERQKKREREMEMEADHMRYK
jgi:hypothetical protein